MHRILIKRSWFSFSSPFHSRSFKSATYHRRTRREIRENERMIRIWNTSANVTNMYIDRIFERKYRSSFRIEQKYRSNFQVEQKYRSIQKFEWNGSGRMSIFIYIDRIFESSRNIDRVFESSRNIDRVFESSKNIDRCENLNERGRRNYIYRWLLYISIEFSNRVKISIHAKIWSFRVEQKYRSRFRVEQKYRSMRKF